MANVTTLNSSNDTIPGWGTGKLIAFVSGEVVSQTVEDIISDTFLPAHPTYTRLVLTANSLTDQTSRVGADGRLQTAGNYASSAQSTWFFAFYERKSLVQNVRFPTNATAGIFSNGSYTVDHFSSSGAKVTINFWREHILTPETKQLLTEAGGLGTLSSAQ